MTARRRPARRRAAPGPPEPLPTQQTPSAPSGEWLVRGGNAKQPGVIWLKRPMPPDQWPIDQRQPRDNSFSWWVRAHCGHRARQFAFYEEIYADVYEHVFRDAPCWWTRCHDDRSHR